MSQSDRTILPSYNACGKNVEFAANALGTAIGIYEGTKKCGEITKGVKQPSGLAVDAQGNLYAAETAQHIVVVFKPPYTGSPAKTYSDPNEYPTDPVACKGYVAVTNIESITGGPGTVTVYRNGKSTMLSDPNVLSEYFAACDGSGNLYTDAIGKNGLSLVNEFAGGTGNAKDLQAITLSYPGGLAWVNARLWVTDQLAKDVTEWQAPFLKAVQTIVLSNACDPIDLAVRPDGQQILTADSCLAAAEFYNLQGQNTGSIPGGTAVAYSP